MIQHQFLLDWKMFLTREDKSHTAFPSVICFPQFFFLAMFSITTNTIQFHNIHFKEKEEEEEEEEENMKKKRKIMAGEAIPKEDNHRQHYTQSHDHPERDEFRLDLGSSLDIIVRRFYTHLQSIIDIVFEGHETIQVKSPEIIYDIVRNFIEDIINYGYSKRSNDNNNNNNNNNNNLRYKTDKHLYVDEKYPAFFLETFLVDEISVKNYRAALLEESLKKYKEKNVSNLINRLQQNGCCIYTGEEPSKSTGEEPSKSTSEESSKSEGEESKSEEEPSKSKIEEEPSKSSKGGEPAVGKPAGEVLAAGVCLTEDSQNPPHSRHYVMQYSNYKMNINMVPEIWGPYMWSIFHCLADKSYEFFTSTCYDAATAADLDASLSSSSRSKVAREKLRCDRGQLIALLNDFIKIIPVLIPCGECKFNYYKNIRPSEVERLPCIGDLKKMYNNIHSKVTEHKILKTLFKTNIK